MHVQLQHSNTGKKLMSDKRRLLSTFPVVEIAILDCRTCTNYYRRVILKLFECNRAAKTY